MEVVVTGRRVTPALVAAMMVLPSPVPLGEGVIALLGGVALVAPRLWTLCIRQVRLLEIGRAHV